MLLPFIERREPSKPPVQGNLSYMYYSYKTYIYLYKRVHRMIGYGWFAYLYEYARHNSNRDREKGNIKSCRSSLTQQW